MGAAYFRRFARPRHGLAIPVQNTSSRRSLTSEPGRTFFTSSLASPPLPGFLFRSRLPAGFIPTSVATGDFNGDGRMDWVVANGGDNNLWLYLGNGDGTSQLPTIIPLVGQSPIALAAVDLRGSGTLDLVVAEADTQTVGVLLGDGHGGFGSEIEIALPAPPLCMLVQDFNGDGHPDILVGMEGTQQTGGLAFLPGIGNGTFGILRTSQGPAMIANPSVANMAAADLNGDGLPDVVAIDAAAEIWTYLNQANGYFGPPNPVDFPYFASGLLPISLALGDINRDGCADLVVLDTWGLADRFLGHCDGTFEDLSTYKAFGAGEVGYGIGLADVNGDGYLDVVSSGFVTGLPPDYFGGQSGRLLSILPGDGSGGFNPPTVYRGEPGMYSLAVADLNGDGHPDVVTANQDTDSVSVYVNDGQGRFGQPQGGYVGNYINAYNWTTLPSANSPGSLMVANDVNGDGKPDLSLLESPIPGDGCGNCENLGVLLNKGSGIFAQVVRSDLLSSNIEGFDFAFGNFRNTGLPDLIIAGHDVSSGAPFFSFTPNDGGGMFGPAAVSASSEVSPLMGLMGVGDFNKDGKLDFVAVQSVSEAPGTSSELTVFLGNGAGGFTPGYSAGFNANSSLFPGQVYVGDFNGDGKLDVLVQETSTLEGTLGHDVYEFLGNGDGTFAPPKIVLTDAGPIAVGDLNHDGRPDIVEQVEPLTTLPFGLPVQYAIYLAQPDGSFSLANTYEPFAGTLNDANWDLGGPILADFNGDGNLDLAVFQSPGDNDFGNEPENYFQILAGNGDSTFTPIYTVFDVTTLSSPQLATDVTGDGRADLIELDGYTSSYQVIPAVPGPAMQIQLVSDPVVGSNGNLQINLALASSSSTTINLSASDPAITIPSSTTIPAGSVSLEVPFQIDSTFNPDHVFSIQAQLGTETETAYGTQATHPAGLAVNFFTNSFTVAGGQTTSDYGVEVFSLNGYSTTVQLLCSGLPAGAVCQFGDTSLAVPSGAEADATLMVATSSSVVPGTYTFTVVATDGTVSGRGSATLAVQGGPAIEISPASLSFPTQSIGTTSAPQTVTVTNSGSAVMTLAISMSLAGQPGAPNPNFAETNNCGGSLAAGAVCAINVTFTPTTTGSVGASLLIDANTIGATRQFVALSGTAGGPLVQISTSSLNFIGEYVGTTSTAQTVTVWNTGTIPINFSGITIAGANAKDFAFGAGTNCSTGAQLGVGVGCGINLTFTPSTAGTRTATLTVADSGRGSPQSVSLSGTANAPDFTLDPASGSSSSATVTAGGSATYSLTVAPLGPFNQTVTLSCPGTPTGATCSVSPRSVTLNGSNAQNVTVTVMTKARALAAPRGRASPIVPLRVLWVAFMGLLALNLLAWRKARRASFGRMRLPHFGKTFARARSRYAFALGFILLTVTLWTSCGGGGSSISAPSSPGTPAGGYTLTVTGTSGSLSHSTVLTLTVN